MAEDVCLQHGFEFVDALALPPTGGSDGDASDDDELGQSLVVDET